ncbi:MAG: pentapeptide repeat-containing protein, partial [Thermoguttaceae bacterium]
MPKIILMTIFAVLVTSTCFAQGDPGRLFTYYIIDKSYVKDGKEPIKIEDELNLSGKSMQYVNINRAYETLHNINFSHADLFMACLDETEFVGCSFKEANLIGVSAIFSKFVDCDFTDAKVYCSNIEFTKDQLVKTKSFKDKTLYGCYLSGDFSNTDFSDFHLEGINLWYATTVAGSNFSDATIGGFSNGSFNRHPFFGCDFSKEQLCSTASYKKGELVNIEFAGIDFSGTDLSKMILTGCNFRVALSPGTEFCNFHGVNLTDSVIEGCDFSDVEN